MTRAVPRTPEPGARALYLGATGDKRVTSTGDALVIAHKGQRQTLRYPLLRLARVVSASAVDWSGDALAACLRRGITIAWIDGRGEPLGTCYPVRRADAGGATALEVMLEAASGCQRLEHWLRARRMDVLIRWGRAQPQAISPHRWEQIKREWVYAGRVTPHLPQALRGLCLAFVGAQMAQHGLQPVLWGPQAQRIDLDQSLCELLWGEMNLGAGRLADAAHEDATVAELFERWSARNASALLQHLYSLQRTALKALHE